MKGKDLIKLITDNNLQEFEIQSIHSFTVDSFWGLEVETFKISGLADIGYSDNKAYLNIDKEIK